MDFNGEHACRVTVFTVLCWLTMVYVWRGVLCCCYLGMRPTENAWCFMFPPPWKRTNDEPPSLVPYRYVRAASFWLTPCLWSDLVLDEHLDYKSNPWLSVFQQATYHFLLSFFRCWLHESSPCWPCTGGVFVFYTGGTQLMDSFGSATPNRFCSCFSCFSSDMRQMRSSTRQKESDFECERERKKIL